MKCVAFQIFFGNPSIVSLARLYSSTLVSICTFFFYIIAMSNLRVINANRSPHAQIFVHMKFEIETPYEKIMIFRAVSGMPLSPCRGCNTAYPFSNMKYFLSDGGDQAVEEYLKDRPREWLTFVGFRPTEVAVERNYINYAIIVQHRNSWQGTAEINESKGYLVTYCLEVAKQLEMRYVAPHLPVSLEFKHSKELTPKDLLAEAW